MNINRFYNIKLSIIILDRLKKILVSTSVLTMLVFDIMSRHPNFVPMGELHSQILLKIYSV